MELALFLTDDSNDLEVYKKSYFRNCMNIMHSYFPLLYVNSEVQHYSLYCVTPSISNNDIKLAQTTLTIIEAYIAFYR